MIFIKFLKVKSTRYSTESSLLPSLCISCQQEGLEISGLYEQWGDYACEDNSSLLPVNEKKKKKKTNSSE